MSRILCDKLENIRVTELIGVQFSCLILGDFKSQPNKIDIVLFELKKYNACEMSQFKAASVGFGKRHRN